MIRFSMIISASGFVLSCHLAVGADDPKAVTEEA